MILDRHLYEQTWSLAFELINNLDETLNCLLV